tara:strand:+ start:267 stop:536 length:270 start_codon:yes stop_codon:yes gene_type:complete
MQKKTTVKLNKNEVTIKMTFNDYSKLLNLSNSCNDIVWDIQNSGDMTLSNVRNLEILNNFLRSSVGFQQDPNNNNQYADAILPDFKVTQ